MGVMDKNAVLIGFAGFANPISYCIFQEYFTYQEKRLP